MKQLVKKTAIRLLSALDAYPTALTRKSDLLSLIHRLHPVAPGVDLIRLGPKGDGGYLVPNDLVGIEACFSPGVSDISGFESDCADRGMYVFLADKSVEEPRIAHERFVFTKKHIGAMTADDFMTIDEWVGSSLPPSGSDLLLQVDIEGYEYEVILNITDALLQRFRILVAEFHMLHLLWSQPFFALASRAFEKILQHHVCVHLHPNNCCGSVAVGDIVIPRVMEFTFMRRERVITSSYKSRFPHPLDSDNTANPTLPLPTCWYRG